MSRCCDDQCDCRRCRRDKHDHDRDHDRREGRFSLKWSGLVNDDSGAGVQRNLADPGTDVASGAVVLNRYPLGSRHRAVHLATRAASNTLTVPATVVVLKNGVPVAVGPVPATDTTVVTDLFIHFDRGDDVEVQVNVAPGGEEGTSLAITVVVEFD